MRPRVLVGDGTQLGHDRAQLDDRLFECRAQLDQRGRDLVLATELSERFAHFRLYEGGADQPQDAVVDASSQRMWGRHVCVPTNYRDCTAVGAMPWVMA